MIYKILILIALVASVLLSGCVDKNSVPPQPKSLVVPLVYSQVVDFCKERGYSSADEYIYEDQRVFGGESLKTKVGYQMFRGDGEFTTDDMRIHTDCLKTVQNVTYHDSGEFIYWLISVGITPNTVNLNTVSNYTKNVFCSQRGEIYKPSNFSSGMLCYRNVDIRESYSPQDIAKWYIKKGVPGSN